MKSRYKQTEVGLIPMDWEVLSLGDFVTFQRGFDLPNRLRKTGDVPIVSSAGIIDFHDMPMVSAPGVVTGRYGTIGEVFYVDEPFWPLNTTLYVRDFHGNDPNFVFHYLRKFDFLAFSGKSGVPGVNRNDLHAERIGIPALLEQSAIATVLSDVDALLAGLDKLIAKKRDLKKAATQQLLTGRIRLPGFSGAWRTRLLGDVAIIKTGSRNNEDKADDGDYPFFVRSDDVERINSYAYDCEAILVPGEGRIGEIFHYINGKFDVHQRVYAITTFTADVSVSFLYLYIKAHFGAWAMKNTVKATVDSLRLPTFQNFKMRLPPSVEEQSEIAVVLSDIDAELTSLEARREKSRLFKEGIMQELLAGKTRLVPA